ncbi:dihydrodipicolinate synthase [Drechmeria coniospora]|uniref:Dihydrodipicolinate synthase n=1 Tax=Drechmeria coniospora TaxID=98403 RepID=A0A151GCZ3_DRECN|nr:dihydrodipicolinate synthase [Drechmeria coniospora]KYK54943.1 dihydrodipicolinate synthase [Drechmeria coniospora]
MAENHSPGQYGLDEPVYGFMADNIPTISDTNSDLSNSAIDPANQPYYASSSNWDFQATPPFESFDIAASTAAPPIQPGSSMVTPWPLPTYHSEAPAQPPASQPASSPSFDGLPKLEVNQRAAAYESSSANTSQNSLPMTAKPQVRAVTAISHEELRNIAMPPHLQYSSPKSASSPESAKAGTGSSPELTGSSAKRDSRKRKMSDELDDDDEVDDEDKPIKKTAHNMIEKRYRTNINDKIAALRDSVPSLRIMTKSARGEDTTEDREELHGLTPAHKLNKATVLSKATEYIRHLEKRNGRLYDENQAMRERIAAFEKLFMAGAMNGSISPMQHPLTPNQFPQEARHQFPNPPLGRPHDGGPNPAGMINVPEDMKRIISAQMAVGQPYPVPQQDYRGNPAVVRQQQIQQQQQQQQQQQMAQNGWANNVNPYFGKLMVGSLAGLMILEAVRETEMSNENPQGRGLFALPAQLLGKVSSALDLHLMGYRIHTSLKILVFLGAVLWVVVPSLFAPPSDNIKKKQVANLGRAPSPASSIHVRRQAWLTAIQTVWVPRHNFFLEAAALVLKTMKLSLRNWIGVHGYQMLTGLTEEQETARVKAWSIALDSQLAGGDVDVCRSRLILTLLASGTLPDTPSRLMLKALHIRILLWDLCRGSQFGLCNVMAAKLARKRWNKARQLNRSLVQLRSDSSTPHENELPEHLVALVEQDCDDVLNVSVVQRAHNLAFNGATAQDVERIDSMDAVVEDTSIGSPLDAVAAWYSCEALHHVLTATLEGEFEEAKDRAAEVEVAVRVAPIGSSAHMRAVLAKAVLVDEGRLESIRVARHAIQTDRIGTVLSNSEVITGPYSHSSSYWDLHLSLNCAKAIACLSRNTDPGVADARALQFIRAFPKPEYMSNMTLLGFTASMELIREIMGCEDVKEQYEMALSKLLNNLRLWMGRPSTSRCGVSSELRNKMIEECLTSAKALAGPEHDDTGYGSLSEAEMNA